MGKSKGKNVISQQHQQHKKKKKKPESSGDDEFLGKSTSSSNRSSLRPSRLLSMGMRMIMMMMKSSQSSPYAIRIALSAGMGGLVIGYHSGIAYSVLRYSHYEFRGRDAPTTWLRFDERMVIGSVTSGSMLATILSGFANDSIARRIYMGLADIVAFAAAIHMIAYMSFCPAEDQYQRDQFGVICLQLCCPISECHRIHPPWAYQHAGFSLMGIAGGLLFMSSPLYIAEVSPTSIRGALVTSFFLQIAAGQIIYFLIRFLTSIKIVGQLMLGVIPTIIHLVSLNRLPESPRWLYRKGWINDAVEIMRKIHPPHEVEKELDSLRLSVETEITEEGSIDNHEEFIYRPCFNALRRVKVTRRLFPVVGCLVAQSLMGFNMVLYYTPTILVHLVGGYDSDNLILISLLVISVLCAIGFVLCIAFVDRYGRRRLLLVSTLGIVACLGLCSYLFYGGGGDSMAAAFTRRSNTTAGYCQAKRCTSISEEERGLSTGLFGLLALVALGLYFIFYSLGIGIIPWIMNSEIYPLRYRNVCGIMAAGFYFLFPIFYADALERYFIKIYIAKAFLLSTLIAFAACLFIYLCIPETKGYLLEEVEKKLLLHAYGCSSTCTQHLLSNPKGSESNKKVVVETRKCKQQKH